MNERRAGCRWGAFVSMETEDQGLVDMIGRGVVGHTPHQTLRDDLSVFVHAQTHTDAHA